MNMLRDEPMRCTISGDANMYTCNVRISSKCRCSDELPRLTNLRKDGLGCHAPANVSGGGERERLHVAG
jgi:hypothetical protein